MNKTLGSQFVLVVIALSGASGCLSAGGGLESNDVASIQSLSSPVYLSVTGDDVVLGNGSSYVLADSTGYVDPTTNIFSSVITDPTLALTVATPASLLAVAGSATCTFPPLNATVSNEDSNSLNLMFGVEAEGCTDQEQITVTFNNGSLIDADGNFGVGSSQTRVGVDLAPVYTQAAGRVNQADPATDEMSGTFKASDTTIYVTFSKNMTAGTLTASLVANSDCKATLNSTTGLIDVTDATGRTVIWMLQGINGMTVNKHCTLDLSQTADAFGNPFDEDNGLGDADLQLK